MMDTLGGISQTSKKEKEKLAAMSLFPDKAIIFKLRES
jgi:hypothetical protein